MLPTSFFYLVLSDPIALSEPRSLLLSAVASTVEKALIIVSTQVPSLDLIAGQAVHFKTETLLADKK